MKHRSFFIPLVSLLFAMHAIPAFAGNGDGWAEDMARPSLLERQVLCLSNACRIAPVDFRNWLLARSDILLPANYPAVGPLRFNDDLGRAARFHSDDMAAAGIMQHNSIDGTDCFTRIRRFFSGSGTMAENIAAGQSSAASVLTSWLMDGNPTPAVDKGGKDGHRANIMNGAYTQIGVGYSSSTLGYKRFWTQDFAGGSNNYSSIQLVDGIHFDSTASVRIFRANWYDAQTRAPQKASLVLEDGSDLPMVLQFGTPGRGTWRYVASLPAGTKYSFVFLDADARSLRYPENGWLVIDTGMVYSAATAIAHGPERLGSGGSSIIQSRSGTLMTLAEQVGSLDCFDCAGRLVAHVDEESFVRSFDLRHAAAGMILLRAVLKNGEVQTGHLINCP